MFLQNQPQDQADYYKKLLKSVGSLSKLFSDSVEPYLAYRIAENIFCKAFGAENVSRKDASVDAAKNGIGVGLKTFLEKGGNSMEKVAEFNKDHSLFRNLFPEEKVRKIAELRNERLALTQRLFRLDKMIYHCVVRQVAKMLVYESPLDFIDIDNIRDVKVSKSGGSIQFSDLSNEYNFNVSKSTLMKRFSTGRVVMEVPVRILEDPFEEIEKLIAESGPIFVPIKPQPHVFLPLYSSKGGTKHVPLKSGLNQWNASGRKRDLDEVYISIPKWIHERFPGFFPPRDVTFELTLPNRDILTAKICQDGDKALMSKHNADLGKWILREVLDLPEGELLTYEKLQTIGLDSVVIYKIDADHYDIDFARIDSYENFLVENHKKEEDIDVFEVEEE